MTDTIEYNLDEEQLTNLQLAVDEISYLDSPQQALEAAIDEFVKDKDLESAEDRRKDQSKYGSGRRFGRGYNSK
jgi:hypothetical protein